MKRLAALLFAIVLAASAMIMPALAIEPFDPHAELTLNVSFEVDGTCCGGVHFRLFRVADMVDFGELRCTEAFKACEIASLTNLTTEQTQELCETLYAYCLEHETIEPVDAGDTDVNGQIAFPVHGNKLLPGLYLVTGDRFYLDGVSHEAAPFVVSLPYRGEDEVWMYDVSASPKLADTQVEVQIVWQDEGYEKNRPHEVVVELIRGSEEEPFASVVLSEENNWSYTWEDLPGGFEWSVRQVLNDPNYKTVTERIPGGFRIINSYTPPLEPSLPQTGLLWWPVPVLVCAGMLLFVLGWSKQRKHEE